MSFIKNLLNSKGLFNDSSVIGLSGLRKKEEYIKVTLPEEYKKTYIPNIEQNYLLF